MNKFQSLRTSRTINPGTLGYTALHRTDKVVALERNAQFMNNMSVTLNKIKEY